MKSRDLSLTFIIAIILNVSFALIEYLIGYYTDSLALLSDALHNVSDVIGLLISFIGLKLIQSKETQNFTYGYKKASILSSSINLVILSLIIINILVSAINRFKNPIQVQSISVIVVASIGIFINFISAYLFYKSDSKDINAKTAFINLFLDVIVSVGVVISGVIMLYTNIAIIDPIISIVIALFIFISLIKVFKENLLLALDGVPKNIDIEKVDKIIKAEKRIIDYHHMHIWALSSNITAITLHITLSKDLTNSEIMDVKQKLKLNFKKINIEHSTIEVDINVKNFKEID